MSRRPGIKRHLLSPLNVASNLFKKPPQPQQHSQFPVNLITAAAAGPVKGTNNSKASDGRLALIPVDTYTWRQALPQWRLTVLTVPVTAITRRPPSSDQTGGLIHRPVNGRLNLFARSASSCYTTAKNQCRQRVQTDVVNGQPTDIVSGRAATHFIVTVRLVRADRMTTHTSRRRPNR